MAAMMEQVIRQFLGIGGDEVQDEEQMVDLLESHLEEEMAEAEREGEEQRTQAQEQVCPWGTQGGTGMSLGVHREGQVCL